MGHTPEPFLYENDCYISTRRCNRCKAQLGMPKLKWKNIPPPNSTPEQILRWEDFCEKEWERIRRETTWEINELLKKQQRS